MKKSSFLILAFLSSILTKTFGQDHADVQGTWYGTASLVEKLSGQYMKSERHIDLTINKNKVTGTVRYSGDVNLGTVGHDECFGTGPGELISVTLRPWDGTYDIHIEGPECTLVAGGGNTGDGVTGIGISNQKLQLINGKLNTTELSGIETNVRDMEPIGTFTQTITWHLVGNLDAQLIIKPIDYNMWMPEATNDELRKGNTMHIDLKVQDHNGGVSSLKVARFELKLSNTSREKGTTLNMPLNPSARQLPDLRFIPHPIAESIDEDQYIEVPSADGKTGTAIIASYDGGGWTTLTAVAVLEGGIRIEGTLLTPTGIKEIPIPKRDPASHIATAWLTDNGNPGEMDDLDKSTGNKNDGDGLTAYEEYRGFICEKKFGSSNPNKFGRLDPKKKDLGVMVKRAEATLFDEGINWLENASGLKVIRFDETEIDSDRKLNRNSQTAHDYDQYAVFLVNEDLPGDAVGETQPENGKPKTPKSAEKVVIDIKSIQQSYRDQAANARAGNVAMPYTETEDIANTVAHELGHSIHMNHHGKSSLVPPRKAYANSSTVFHIFWFNSTTEETDRPYPGGSDQYLEPASTEHNDASGDLRCIMAYTSRYNWAYRKSNVDGSLYYYKVPLLPVGKIFCTSKQGTDINRPSLVGVNNVNKYFGDADPDPDFGNCLSQIKLRD